MTKKNRHSSSAELLPDGIITNPEDFSPMLFERGFGTKQGRQIWLFPEEALYLMEEGYLEVSKRGRKLSVAGLLKQLKNSKTYAVYKDLKQKGYLPKAGAKYGVDFRVYGKGVKPGKGTKLFSEHARFLVWVLSDSDKLKPSELIGMSRVAHSVKKPLMIAVVDKDLGVTYNQLTRAVP